MSFKIRYRLWVEKDGKTIIGPGAYEILKEIDETKSIAAAARKLGFSYKFIWSYIKKIEEELGEPVVESRRGGKEKGQTDLTPIGKQVLDAYEQMLKEVEGLIGRWEMRFTAMLGGAREAPIYKRIVIRRESEEEERA